METVIYFSVDYAPGKFFNCERQRSTLSQASCAAQYLKHKNNLSSSVCVKCEIGAIHVGEKIVYGLPEKLCCRCGRTDQRLIFARVCVSCSNREREFKCGKNSKGKPPIHARPLYNMKVFNAHTGDAQTCFVADAAEAAMVALRKNPKTAVVLMNPTVPDYIFAEWRLK